MQTRWLLTSDTYTSPWRSRAMPEGATLVGPAHWFVPGPAIVAITPPETLRTRPLPESAM